MTELVLVAVLAGPVVLLLGFVGCAVVAPFDEDSLPEPLSLTVEARFGLPGGTDVHDLTVIVDVTGDGDDYGESHEPTSANGELVYQLTFPELLEGRYVVFCNVYAGPGDPVVASPRHGCVVVLNRELGAGRIVFRADAEGRTFACGGA